MVKERVHAPMRDESGQAVVEYLLLLGAIVSFFLIVNRGLGAIGLGDKLASPLRKQFAATYRYGHPKATGPEDDAGAKHHPRVVGGQNFRIFLNPSQKN